MIPNRPTGEPSVYEDVFATHVISFETFSAVTVALSALNWIGSAPGTACASSAGTASVSVIRASLVPMHSVSVSTNRAAGAGWTAMPRASALTPTLTLRS